MILNVPPLPCRKGHKYPYYSDIKTVQIEPKRSESEIELLREEHRLNLRDLRLKKGWSQQELAFILGCSFRTISDWETGKKLPRLDFAVSLAIVLECELDLIAEAFGLG